MIFLSASNSNVSGRKPVVAEGGLHPEGTPFPTGSPEAVRRGSVLSARRATMLHSALIGIHSDPAAVLAAGQALREQAQPAESPAQNPETRSAASLAVITQASGRSAVQAETTPTVVVAQLEAA